MELKGLHLLIQSDLVLEKWEITPHSIRRFGKVGLGVDLDNKLSDSLIENVQRRVVGRELGGGGYTMKEHKGETQWIKAACNKANAVLLFSNRVLTAKGITPHPSVPDSTRPKWSKNHDARPGQELPPGGGGGCESRLIILKIQNINSLGEGEVLRSSCWSPQFSCSN